MRRTGGNCRTTKEARWRNIFRVQRHEGGGEKKKTNQFCERGDGEDAPEVGTEAYENVLKPFWKKEFLPAQKLMESKKHLDIILSMIPDENVRSQAEFDFKNDKKPKPSIDSTSISTWRWQRIEKNVEKALKTKYGWELARCLQ